MDLVNKTALFWLLCFLLLSRCEAKRNVDCRKYVFAPVCRGAAAKRDIQKLEPLFEEPRTPRYVPSDEKFLNMDSFSGNRGTNENAVYDKAFMDTFLKKLAPKNIDYDTGTGNC